MKSTALLSCIVALTFVGACGDSDGDAAPTFDAGPTADAGVRAIDLLGTWNATSHTFTNNADSNETYDVLGTGGETRMTVLAGGGTRTFRTIDGASDDHDSMLEGG